MSVPRLSIPRQAGLPSTPIKYIKQQARRFRALLLALAVLTGLNLGVTALEPFFFSLVYGNDNAVPAKISFFQQKSNIDILFMGTSRPLSGFNPTLVEEELSNSLGLKLNSFNLGIAGAGFDLNYAILKNYIPEDKKPRFIVYGITERELLDKNSPYRSSTLPYYSVFQRPDDFELFAGDSFENKANFVASQVFPLYRDQKLILNGLNLLFNPDNPALSNNKPLLQPDYQASGFYPIENLPETKASRIEHARTEYETFLPTASVEAVETVFLEKFVNLAKARGIQVILVNMPVTNQHKSWWHNEANVQKYCDVVQEFARAHKLPLLNLYCKHEAVYTEALFDDTHHLNLAGAKVLSQQIAREYFVPLFKAQIKPETLYKASFSDVRLPARLSKNLVTWGSVTIQNTSGNIWPGGLTSGVRLAYHWLDASGKMVTHEGIRSLFNSSIFPGQKQQVRFQLMTPLVPGNYILELDLLNENVAWFGVKGNPTLRKNITITAGG
ncbi:MAG: hypothetical protein JWP00_4666 [Chloroflexi bacterium]|jgi:hypothetical protein|nr:hypothetical protein [Chloroflexota bacterium]